MSLQEVDRQPKRDLHELLLRLIDLDSAIETGIGTMSTTDDFITYLNALSLSAIDAQVRDRLVFKFQQAFDAALLADADIAAAAGQTSGSRLSYLTGLLETDDSELANDTFATRLPGD
jgi:hypothetical protein